jgi:hypothetical protein
MILNIITIFTVFLLGWFFIKLYEAKRVENPSVSPSEVFNDLLENDTVESVTRALEQPKYGDIGSFTGYDWPQSKQSGVGGPSQLMNPSKLSMLRLGKYVPFDNPSINKLM